MKNITIFTLAALLLAASPARAQEIPFYDVAAQAQRQQLSPPANVAMVFYKLTGQQPNFESWAKQTQAYKDAPPFNKSAVLTQQLQQVRDAYRLLTIEEPLAIATTVKLSAYSAANKGFFVENFKSSTYFPAYFDGRFYALVPRGIVDSQWIAIADEALAKEIDDAVKASSTGLLTMVVYLVPKSADKSAPLMLEGADHWLIETAIRGMKLYNAGGTKLLWDSTSEYRSQTTKDLLNLYQ